MKWTRGLLLSSIAILLTGGDDSLAIRTPGYIVIDSPIQSTGVLFGNGNCFADYDGDGDQDLAIGAPGIGLVFFYENIGTPTIPQYKWNGIRASGYGSETADQFGHDLAAADIDGDGREEVLVGAPHHTRDGIRCGALYVVDALARNSKQLLPTDANIRQLGTSVVFGDFNSDGQIDAAGGAPASWVDDGVDDVTAGAVTLYFGGGPGLGEHVIRNPEPVTNGNFGHELGVTDTDSDKPDRLAVSAVGNSSSGYTLRGQAFVFGPMLPKSKAFKLNPQITPPAPRMREPITLQDPDIDIDDPIVRWGMSLFARGPWVGIAGNRKDWEGMQDTGVGYLFHGSSFSLTETMTNSVPAPFALLGLDSVCANVIGDDTPDLCFSHVKDASNEGGLPRSLLVWDGATGEGPIIFKAADSAGHHCYNAMDYAMLTDSEFESVSMGDGRYSNQHFEVGRLTIMILN